MKEEQIKNIKTAYTEIMEVCDKHVGKDELISSEFRDIKEMVEKCQNHLILIDWSEKYGIDIPHDRRVSGYDFIKIDDNRYFSYFKNAEEEKEKGYGRYISWEDNGKQPKDEWLFCLSYSTGAYIFGDDYPKDLFQEFWNELKSYNPKYCDTTNHGMYFAIESAKDIYNGYKTILNKYYEKNKVDAKERKIKKLQAELNKLIN